MNPIEWAKSLYGAIGAKHPTGSYVGVMALCALLGGVLWWVASQLYQKDRPNEFLKARTLQLSSEILKFLADRERLAPQLIPRYVREGTPEEAKKLNNEIFRQHGEETTRFSNETKAKYQEQFSARVALVIDELKQANIDVTGVARYSDFPIPVVIPQIATGLAVCAGSLK